MVMGNKLRRNDTLMQAYQEIARQRLDKIPTESEIKQFMKFTEDFEEKGIYVCLKKSFVIRGIPYSRAAVYIFLIIFLLSSITVFAIYKTRLIEHIFDKNTKIIVETEKDAVYKNTIEIPYQPSYLPDGYYFVKTNGDEEPGNVDHLFSQYTNGSYDINVRQLLLTAGTKVDNEDTEQSKVFINGNEAIYFSKNGEWFITWSQYEYMFIIETNAPITEDELIKIAESFQKRD